MHRGTASKIVDSLVLLPLGGLLFAALWAVIAFFLDPEPRWLWMLAGIIPAGVLVFIVCVDPDGATEANDCTALPSSGGDWPSGRSLCARRDVRSHRIMQPRQQPNWCTVETPKSKPPRSGRLSNSPH